MVNITLIKGEGKGKTTLSMGYIFQKQREGKSILVAQFLKTGVNCGECNFFRNRENIIWISFGKEEFFHSKTQKEEYTNLLNKGVNILEKELEKTNVDVLLLDEAGIALHFELFSWERIEEIYHYAIDEVVLTGRIFPEEVISKADTIIEVEEIKHPYNKGIEARIGIDF
jgi:cob(I)alamin adenosyltransferase